MTFELEDIFAHTEDFTTFKHKPKVFHKSLKWLLGLALTVGCVGGAGALAGNNPKVEKAIKEMENEVMTETKVTVIESRPAEPDTTKKKQQSKGRRVINTTPTRTAGEAFAEICPTTAEGSEARRLCDEYNRGLNPSTVIIHTRRHN